MKTIVVFGVEVHGFRNLMHEKLFFSHSFSLLDRRSWLSHEHSLHEHGINVKRIIYYFLLHCFHVRGML